MPSPSLGAALPGGLLSRCDSYALDRFSVSRSRTSQLVTGPERLTPTGHGPGTSNSDWLRHGTPPTIPPAPPGPGDDSDLEMPCGHAPGPGLSH